MRRPPSSDAIHDHVYDASICAMRDHLRAFGVCLFYDASTTLSVVSVYVASDTIASTTRDPTLPTLGLRPTAFATTFGDQEALLGARPTGASTGASTTSDNRFSVSACLREPRRSYIPRCRHPSRCRPSPFSSSYTPHCNDGKIKYARMQNKALYFNYTTVGICHHHVADGRQRLRRGAIDYRLN